MKCNAIVSAVVALSLACAGPVAAQPNEGPAPPRVGQRGYHQPAQPRGPHQAGRPDLRQPRGARQPGPRAYPPPAARAHPQPGPRAYAPPGAGYQRHAPPGYYYPGARGSARGVGPDFRYHRGDRLPLEYRSWNYVIDDWQPYYLSPPPRGYHWVQVGADYVLVAIATGIILELLLHN